MTQIKPMLHKWSQNSRNIKCQLKFLLGLWFREEKNIDNSNISETLVLSCFTFYECDQILYIHRLSKTEQKDQKEFHICLSWWDAFTETMIWVMCWGIPNCQTDRLPSFLSCRELCSAAFHDIASTTLFHKSMRFSWDE